MKTVLKTTFFLMLFFLTRTIGAQNSQFAPTGAIWYYETQSLYSTGYIKMEVEKDTVVNNYSCVKVIREAHWHDLLFNELKEFSMPALFLTQINDSVMILHNGAFHKLFDFGAEIGNTWTIVGKEGLCEEDFGTVSVVDKGVVVVNGMPLKFVTIKDDTFSYWGYGNTLYGTPAAAIQIAERIGPIGSYFLPQQKCVFDESEGGPLRCYYDDELGEIHLSSLYPERNCDYISEAYQSVGEYETGNSIMVFPNPCSERIQLHLNETGSCEIIIVDYSGKTIMRDSIDEKETTIDVTSLPVGLYCIIVLNGTEVKSTIIFKK